MPLRQQVFLTCIKCLKATLVNNFLQASTSAPLIRETKGQVTTKHTRIQVIIS